MRLNRLVLGFALLCAACAHRPNLSGPLAELPPASQPHAPIIGILADSQLQSLPAWRNTHAFYRRALADRIVSVTIRPPALDWSSRHIMLAHLAELRAQGAQTIFYLGDGANHGCTDEFSAGLGVSRDQRRELHVVDQGILALLDTFRNHERIPIFFVLGNHDFLAAGSTADGTVRERLCSNPEGGANPPLSKGEVIALVDAFNRGNDAIGTGWRYRSSFSISGEGPGSEALCRGPSPQRRWGCYLAATVDHEAGGNRFQFLLLDTNDYPGVSSSSLFGHDVEGERGAMSWGDSRHGVPSQTAWFETNARDQVEVRTALTHYDVGSLRKKILTRAVWNLSQQFMNIFTTTPPSREPLQTDAYVISGHTHAQRFGLRDALFSTDCRWPNCRRENRFPISELNVGSTTDYPNVSAIVQIVPPAGQARGAMRYSEVLLNPPSCPATMAELAVEPFPRPVLGHATGERAVGIDRDDRHNYHRLGHTDLMNLFANLRDFVGDRPERAICIGRVAAAVEASRRPPY